MCHQSAKYLVTRKKALKFMQRKKKKVTFLAGEGIAALKERNLGGMETNTQLGAEKASPATHCAHPRLFICRIPEGRRVPG